MLTDYTDEESLMEIKFIAHSGFLVRLPSADLLFDYFRGELPEPEPGKPMFVFVSHAHADHFSKEIFSLAGKSSLVTFLLSDDIPWTEVPEECERQAEFLGPDMELSFPFPNGGELTVRTYLSTDEGIAFLVDADGARIYHAGDLNDWHWDDIDLPWNEEQRTGYSASLSAIAEVVEQDGRIPDAAFVPVDSRLGEFFWMGMDGYMQKVGARYLFPMHLFGDSKVIARLKAHPCAASYADRILGTGTEGEVFDITEGETE